MVKLFLITVYLLCLVPKADAVNESEFHKITNNIVTRLKEPVIRCADRVWPRYNWKNLDIHLVLYMEETRRAVIWSAKTETFHDFDYENIPAHARTYFSKFTLDGKKILNRKSTFPV